MRTNVLSTLGVFTTFCQPVSSCVYGSSLQPPAEGGLEGSRFAYTNPVERLQWSQLTLNSDGFELWNVGATVGVLVNAIIGTGTKGNTLRRFGVDTSTEQNSFREYFSAGSNLDPDTTAVAFLTPLDMTHSTQVFDIALSPVTHIVELGKIASATAGQFSVPSAVAHPNNNPVMRYSGSPTTPSCSEGVDGMVTVAGPLPSVTKLGMLRRSWCGSTLVIYRGSSGSLTSYSWRPRHRRRSNRWWY